MSNHVTSIPTTVQTVQQIETTGKQFERRKYLSIEVVVMWVAYVLTIAGNALIEGGKLAGETSATIAYAVFTWFTPAGYVFSIWSLIYVALIVWLVSYTRAAPLRSGGFSIISILFVVSCILNVGWLALWHFNAIAIAFVVIIAEWVVLVSLYLRVRQTATTVSGRVPISLYTAWMTVAMLANMAILITRSLDGGMDVLNGLSVVLLAAGVLTLGYIMKKAYRDATFALVFFWALVGVGVHVFAVSILTSVIVFVLVGAGAVLTFVPFSALQMKERP